MEVRKDDFMQDIMHAEQIVKLAIEEAEKEATEIVTQANIEAQGLRDKSMAKIQAKSVEITKKYDKKIEEVVAETEVNAQSFINQLQQETTPKCDVVAKTILKEILADVGCENE
ncbi:MAG: hypothetical protein IKQ31_01905 [Clostridia bacterium]|nr:hypothetical protein [Clostridia bacterium]